MNLRVVAALTEAQRRPRVVRSVLERRSRIAAMAQDVDQVAGAYLWQDSAVLALRLDDDGTVVRANPRALRLLGTAIVGRPFASLVAADPGGVDAGGLVHLHLADGGLETLRLTRIDLPPGALLLGEVDDAERRLLHGEILVLNDELQNFARELARKNADLKRLVDLRNRFLGMAAHDLRGPVATMLGYAELLIDETEGLLGEELRVYLHAIHKSGTFMARIIDDFLDFAVLEAGRLSLLRSAIDPADIVAAGLTLAEAKARRKGVVCHIDAPPLGLMWLDGPKLEQVLVNLVSNAIEHSPRGETVWVTSQREAGAWKVTVRDHGSGMDAATQARLFAPYETGNSKKTAGERATGLGLTISKMIVDAHGGSMEVASQPDAGTAFTVRIPADAGPTR